MGAQFFGKEASVIYDEKNSKMAPIMENLHFLMRLVLKDLPANAQVLCVGVGTGAEILGLGKEFPQWKFTGVDPAPAMLEVCRERLKKNGLLDRCELVNGYLSDIPESEKYDAVLCILVGHFVKVGEERESLYGGIYKRLKPKGYLINAEISYDLSSSEFPSMVEKWKAMHRLSGASEENLAGLPQVLKDVLSILPPEDVGKLLRQSGFPLPVQFFQALLIHAWYARREN